MLALVHFVYMLSHLLWGFIAEVGLPHTLGRRLLCSISLKTISYISWGLRVFEEDLEVEEEHHKRSRLV